MKLAQRIASVFRGGTQRKSSDAITSADLLGMISGTGYARSGALVGWYNALAVSTVFGCVRVIAEDMAKCDFLLEQRDGKALNPTPQHPVYELLAYQPNEWLTAFEFKEMMTAWCLLTGNAVALKTISPLDGRILELLPIPPPWVFIRRIPGQWALRYTITFPNGMGTIEVGPEAVLHLRGPTYDSFVGADIIRLAREAVGLAMAGEEHQARLAEGSDAAPTYISYPQGVTITQAQVDELQKFIRENSGVRHANETLIMREGGEIKPRGTVGQKAEILATRQFQVEEICRFFRVFPQMVGFTDKAMTHASAQDFFQAHVNHTLTPWAKRWEQAGRRDLLTPQEKAQGYAPKMMLDDLLRGDPTTRGNLYKDLAQVGSITPNEVRIKEGMNPLPFDYMDEPIRPVNMQPSGDNDEDDQTPPPGAKPSAGSGASDADPEDDERDPDDEGDDDASD